MNTTHDKKERLISYVNSLELAQPTKKQSPEKISQKALQDQDNNTTGEIIAGSITVFSDALSAQDKSDVRNSTLLAQLAANKAVDRFTNGDEWHSFYIDTLSSLGWIDVAFDSKALDGAIHDWQSTILENQHQSSSSQYPELASLGMSSWSQLDINGDAMSIWNNNALLGNVKHFQIIPTIKLNEDIQVQISNVFASETPIPSGFLSWGIEGTQFNSVKTLDLSFYDFIREAVADKIKDHLLGNTADLPLVPTR